MNRKEEFKKELVNLLQQCVDEGLTVYFHKELTEEEKKMQLIPCIIVCGFCNRRNYNTLYWQK